MLDPKPKAIDMVEEVKKKLITYAKNMATFCDRLNLEWFFHHLNSLSCEFNFPTSFLAFQYMIWYILK